MLDIHSLSFRAERSEVEGPPLDARRRAPISAEVSMLLAEDVVMNAEEIRLPSRPLDETPPLPPPCLPEEERQAADEMPLLPISPPAMPWPRVFPSL
jgi:hypothetical protein